MTLKLVYDHEIGAADCVVESGRYAEEEGLTTQALITVMTDARAEPQQVDPGQDLRGWWAAQLLDLGPEIFGSLLWLLEHRKNTAGTEADARRWAEEAFAWWVSNRLAERVEVSTERDRETLLLTPRIYKPEDPNPAVEGPWEALHRAV